jgi:AcrR family transcriptional regulator
MIPRNSAQNLETASKRFLNAAERVFASRGYVGTTIRAIAVEANANLGTLHQYWGSKQALYRAVCERRFKPVSKAQLAGYERLEKQRGQGAAPDLRDVLRAWVQPAYHCIAAEAGGGQIIRLLYGRFLTEPSEEVAEVMRDVFGESISLLLSLLKSACPGLGDQEFFLRTNCLIGAFAFSQAYSVGLAKRLHVEPEGISEAEAIECVIDFLAGGMKAGVEVPRFERIGIVK